jgi:hypothetical protein
LDKLLNEREDTIIINDKTDNQGNPAGTIVIVTFNKML